MKILLTGAAGQLGQELLPLLADFGDVTSVDRQAGNEDIPGFLQQDLSDLNRLEILLNRLHPDLIVNAAAYTAVDAAESDSGPAFRLNEDLPACLARWVRANGSFMFHYSTDYVFDGRKGEPYQENDEPAPGNVYGESKLAGELAIAASKCRHIILRTSWVYSAHGSNFVLSMLRLARERTGLSIVNDQTGCPTWARNLARVSARLTTCLRAQKSEVARDGLYHYCDRTVTTWHDFACSIFDIARGLGLLETMPEITAVNSSEFPQVAARPMFSVLDTQSIKQAFDIDPAGLNESLKICLKELQDHEQ
jgi:dTDP-4-dehydrorhamnose reductase